MPPALPRYIALVNGEAKTPAPAIFTPPGGPVMPQVTFREPYDRAREMSETVILALRLRDGLDLAEFASRYGVTLEQAFAAPLAETQALGLTEIVGGRFRLRDEAVLLGDEAMLRFLPAEDEPAG